MNHNIFSLLSAIVFTFNKCFTPTFSDTEFPPHEPHPSVNDGSNLKLNWWSISANGNCELAGCSAYGSSFAAPRVTAAAVKVKEKYSWMTGHELKQTILTTAKDLGQPGVDTIFGLLRSEERRVGKECRSRWSPYH